MTVPAPARRSGGVANLSSTASSGVESGSWLSACGLHFIRSYLEGKGHQFHGTEPPQCNTTNVDLPMPGAAGTSSADSQPPPPLVELDFNSNSDSNSNTFALHIFWCTTNTYRCPVCPNRMHR
jgi:hypothetical protein